MDNISRDMLRAKALGYGCHYGKYKADHPDPVPEQPQPKKETEQPTKICRFCGQEFTDGTRNANARYCDVQCYRQANAQRNKLKSQQARGITADTTRECAYCGKPFLLANVNGNNIYCSPECKQQKRHDRQREKYERRNDRA